MQPSATDLQNTNSFSISTSEIEAMVQSMFQATLDLDIELCTAGPADDDDYCLMATIGVTGGWNAEISIAVDQDLADIIAQAMFASDPEDLSDEEIDGALAEVVNVIGGNIKGAATNQPCQLSLPKVQLTDWSNGQKGRCFRFETEGKLLTLLVNDGSN